MTILTRKKNLTMTASLMLLLPLTLAGCGGGADGEYVASPRYGYSDGRLATVSVDGDSIRYEEIDCDGKPNDRATSVGELNKDKTQVSWTQEGNWEGSDPVSVTDGALSIGSDRTFSKEGTEESKEAHAQYEESCEKHRENVAQVEENRQREVADGVYYSAGYTGTITRATIKDGEIVLENLDCNHDVVDEPRRGAVDGYNIRWKDDNRPDSFSRIAPDNTFALGGNDFDPEGSEEAEKLMEQHQKYC